MFLSAFTACSSLARFYGVSATKTVFAVARHLIGGRSASEVAANASVRLAFSYFRYEDFGVDEVTFSGVLSFLLSIDSSVWIFDEETRTFHPFLVEHRLLAEDFICLTRLNIESVVD
jgi:hypothetical protein